MHCDSTQEVIDQLVDDVGVDPQLVGHLTLVVPISVAWSGNVLRRRVLEVALLRPGKPGPQPSTLIDWSVEGDSFNPPHREGLSTFADYLKVSEKDVSSQIAKRAGVLQELVDDGAGGDAIEESVSSYGKYAR
jgi:hypothetical protein